MQSARGEKPIESIKVADSFAELYERDAPAVLRFFQRRTMCPETAADLTAETFSAAFSSRDAYLDNGSSTTAWIFGVARNQLRRYHRRSAVSNRARRRLGVSELRLHDDDFEEVERLVDHEWQVQLLELAGEVLSPAEALTVQLRIEQEMPYSLVAAELNCTEGAARVRVSRALTKLSDRLEKLCPDLRSHF